MRARLGGSIQEAGVLLMAKSLNALFAEANGEPIVLAGQTIHIAYKRRIRAGHRFTVEFLSWSLDRPEGVNLRTKGGVLKVNEVRSSAISLWVDSSPSLVEVVCVKAPRDGLLLVSNHWRRPDGVDDEWTNNAGIIVEESDDSVVLRCSDGIGPPKFDDLVVELGFGMR